MLGPGNANSNGRWDIHSRVEAIEIDSSSSEQGRSVLLELDHRSPKNGVVTTPKKSQSFRRLDPDKIEVFYRRAVCRRLKSSDFGIIELRGLVHSNPGRKIVVLSSVDRDGIGE
jgi:hypothetical protein